MSSWIRLPLAARLLVPALALALAATSLPAQADPDTIKLRNDCRLAQQVLTTGQPSPYREDALELIGICGREAAPAIAAVWNSIEANREELGLLVTATRAIMTPELVETLFATLDAPARPLDVRVAALTVLITYADPAVLPGVAAFVGDSTELLVSRYGRVDHPLPAVGRETTEPVTSRLRARLEALASADATTEMRVAARVALRNAPFN